MKQYSNELDLRRFTAASRRLWWVYAAALGCALAVIFWYSRHQMPEYEAEGIVLIENGDDAGSAVGLDGLARTFSLGGFGSSSTDNEKLVIATNEMRSRVIRELGLNFTTVLNDGLSRTLLYGDSPVDISAPQEMLDTLRAGIKIKIALDHGTVSAKATKGLFPKTLGEVKSAQLPCVLATPYGDFNLTEGPGYGPGLDAQLTVTVTGTPAMSEALTRKITVDVVDKTADAISVKMLDPNPARAKAIVNATMAGYNALRLTRKHQLARQEAQYYTERVAETASQLRSQEKKIEEFRNENRIISAENEAAMLFESTKSDERSIKNAENERAYYKKVLQALNSKEPGILIPASETLGNPMIVRYNELMLKRKRIERSATPENAAVKAIDSEMADLRPAITKNVEDILQRLDMRLATTKMINAGDVSRLQEMPALQRRGSDLARDRQLQSEFYMMLLSKQEEAQMKAFVQTDPGFIFEQAYADTKPGKMKFFLVSAILLILAGMGSVCLVVVWMRATDTASHPYDLANMGLEAHTAVAGTSPASLKELRAIVTATPGGRVFYTLQYDHDAGQAIGTLAANMERLGMNATVEIFNADDNDALFTPAARARVAQLAGEGRKVFAMVPVSDSPSQLLPLLREPYAAVLAVVKAGTKRAWIRRHLGCIPADRLYVALLAND